MTMNILYEMSHLWQDENFNHLEAVVPQLFVLYVS